MYRVASSTSPSRRLMRAGMLSVSMFVAGLAALAPAAAQTLIPLRGEISEEEAANDLLRKGQRTETVRGNNTDPAVTNATTRQGNTGTPVPTARPPRLPETVYQPASPGGLTEAEERAAQPDTIADETATPEPSDPFAEAPPIPQERPSSRRQRQADSEENATNNRTRTAQTRTTRRAADQAQAEEDQQAFTTGTVRTPRSDSEEREALQLDKGAERADAIEGLGRKPEENPYEAVGVRAGTFILRPTIEQGATYTTNANSSPDGAEAVLSETTLRLNAVSDWSEHKASLDAYGIYRKSLSGEEIDQKEAGIDAKLDLDLSHEYKLKSALGYSVKPESASSPVFLGNVVEQPLRHNFNGSIGLSKELGKLEFGITAKADRNIYEDAELAMGGTLDQGDRNATLASVALRTGYEISPAVKPFAELELGRRIYDEEFDSAGYQRSADRLAARAGVELDMREKLTGEFSAGWLRESFDDDRLQAISGLTLNADLRWSPERDTTVGLNASTTVEGTTNIGESGSILHSGKLSLERKIRANLTANAALGLDYRTYSGTSDNDVKWSAELGATWWLNRYAGLTGRLRHEQQTSDLPGRDYKAESVFVGVKVQR